MKTIQTFIVDLFHVFFIYKLMYKMYTFEFIMTVSNKTL